MDDDAVEPRPRDILDPDLAAGDAPDSRFDQWRQRAMDAFADATERIPLIGSVVAAAQRERAQGGGLLAGGVAYRLFFWIVPTGLAAAALGSLAGYKQKGGLESTAGSRGLAAVVATAERQAMDANKSARWYLAAVGIGLSIWFGLGVVRALAIVHALAWEESIPKLRRPLLAGAAFTIFTGILALASWILSTGTSAVGLGPLAFVLTLILTYGGAAFLLSLFFPHGGAPRRAVLPGCLFLTVGGIVLQVIVKVYLAPKLGRSVNTYGLLGAASVILLWLYIVARLITVSAFLNAALWRDRH
jgi:uncharacterized BrkB/YihY/UPF0761 family membrane protein